MKSKRGDPEGGERYELESGKQGIRLGKREFSAMVGKAVEKG